MKRCRYSSSAASSIADAASTPTKPGPVITRASTNRPSRCRCVREESDRSTDDFRRDRGRQTLHQGHARSGTWRHRGAGRFDGALERAGARRNLCVLDARACNRQHQRGRIAEVLYEVDRTGAVRQVADRIELQLDVVELLSGVRKTFNERHKHRGDARAGV